MVSIYFTGVMVVVRSAKDGLIEIFLYHMSEYSDKDERKTDSNYFLILQSILKFAVTTE